MITWFGSLSLPTKHQRKPEPSPLQILFICDYSPSDVYVGYEVVHIDCRDHGGGGWLICVLPFRQVV